MSEFQKLNDRITDKSAVVGVIGLGYVGLPLINAFMTAGYRTMGFDVDQKKVDSLKAGRSYIKHIQSATIGKWIKEDRFEPTADMARLGEADALLICVPTPLSESRDPDLTYVENTARSIGAALRPGQLVVLESTTYPSTTRDVVLPILKKSGLTSGKDLLLSGLQPGARGPGQP
jgi:UDP-N-acetyl-D-glucosamine dehydrogenase